MKMTKEKKIGLFIIISLLITIILINFLRGNDILQGNKTYYTEFSNIDGIEATTPIYINGYKCGIISKIKYLEEKEIFNLELNIKKEFKIPEDSHTSIYSSDLLGGKALKIIKGESKVILENKSFLSGTVEKDMINSILSEIDPLKSDIAELIQNLNTTVKKVNNLLDDNTTKEIKSIITNINEASKNLNKASKYIAKSSPEIESIISNINDFTNGLNKTLKEIDKGAKNIEEITMEIKNSNISTTIENLTNLLIKIQDPNGSFGKILAKDSLHNSLLELSKHLDSLIIKISENPRKNLKISVF